MIAECFDAAEYAKTCDYQRSWTCSRCMADLTWGLEDIYYIESEYHSYYFITCSCCGYTYSCTFRTTEEVDRISKFATRTQEYNDLYYHLKSLETMRELAWIALYKETNTVVAKVVPEPESEPKKLSWWQRLWA